eukprot:Platyproteum_vivax@DN16397_c0_g1_i1.p1
MFFSQRSIDKTSWKATDLTVAEVIHSPQRLMLSERIEGTNELLDKVSRKGVDERAVALFFDHKTSKIHCIDANCYHAAGKLELCQDIEDINSHRCIRCPLHRYVISLETGEGFYEAVEFVEVEGVKRAVVTGWKSKGPKQRVHHVKIESDEKILVHLNLNGELPSDEFSRLE